MHLLDTRKGSRITSEPFDAVSERMHMRKAARTLSRATGRRTQSKTASRAVR